MPPKHKVGSSNLPGRAIPPFLTLSKSLICRSLPFTADVAFFECACVPLLILCVRCAVPLTAVFAARAGWSAAGLIQMRLRLACRCRALAGFLSCGLWMHGGTSSRRFYSRRPALAINSRVSRQPSCDRFHFFGYPVIGPIGLKEDVPEMLDAYRTILPSCVGKSLASQETSRL